MLVILFIVALSICSVTVGQRSLKFVDNDSSFLGTSELPLDLAEVQFNLAADPMSRQGFTKKNKHLLDNTIYNKVGYVREIEEDSGTRLVGHPPYNQATMEFIEKLKRAGNDNTGYISADRNEGDDDIVDSVITHHKSGPFSEPPRHIGSPSSHHRNQIIVQEAPRYDDDYADNSAAAPLTVSSVYSFTPKPPRQHENHIYFTPQPSQTHDNNMLEQKKAGSLRGSFSTVSHRDTHAMASMKHAT